MILRMLFASRVVMRVTSSGPATASGTEKAMNLSAMPGAASPLRTAYVSLAATSGGVPAGAQIAKLMSCT
jgi:hypothetical protein